MFRRHKKLFIWAVVLFMLAGTGIAGFLLARNEPRVVEDMTETSDVPAAAEDARVAKGARIIWDYEYRMCSHLVCRDCEADEDMIGLSFSEFQSKYPDVRIITFEPHNLVLKMSFDCYCPKHYIIRKHKEGLAVMRTIEGTDEQEIYLNLPIKFSDVNEDERKVLEAGKIFDSLEELEQFIKKLGA